MQSPYFLEWIVILLGKTHFSFIRSFVRSFVRSFIFMSILIHLFPIDSMDFVISLIFEGQCKLSKLIKSQIYTIIASNSSTSHLLSPLPHFLKCVSIWKKPTSLFKLKMGRFLGLLANTSYWKRAILSAMKKWPYQRGALYYRVQFSSAD